MVFVAPFLCSACGYRKRKSREMWILKKRSRFSDLKHSHRWLFEQEATDDFGLKSWIGYRERSQERTVENDRPRSFVESSLEIAWAHICLIKRFAPVNLVFQHLFVLEWVVFFCEPLNEAKHRIDGQERLLPSSGFLFGKERVIILYNFLASRPKTISWKLIRTEVKWRDIYSSF